MKQYKEELTVCRKSLSRKHLIIFQQSLRVKLHSVTVNYAGIYIKDLHVYQMTGVLHDVLQSHTIHVDKTSNVGTESCV